MTFNFTKAEFDLWAPTYDEDATGRASWVAHEFVSATVVKHAPAQDVRHVIDLGTGTGLLLPHLKKQFENAVLIGVDFSSNILDECRKKNLAEELIEFDLTESNWPFAERKPQVVTASGVLEFIRDRETFVGNVAETLATEGLAVVTYSPPLRGKSPRIGASNTYSHPHDCMANAFVAAGFQILEQTEFAAYQYYGSKIHYGLIAGRKLEI